jgi:hypothetical protein
VAWRMRSELWPSEASGALAARYSLAKIVRICAICSFCSGQSAPRKAIAKVPGAEPGALTSRPSATACATSQ